MSFADRYPNKYKPKIIKSTKPKRIKIIKPKRWNHRYRKSDKNLQVDYVNGIKTCGDCSEELHFSKYSFTKIRGNYIPRSNCKECRSIYNIKNRKQ